MPETARAKLASVWSGKNKFNEDIQEISVAVELEDGRKLYDNLRFEGGSNGAIMHSRIACTSLLKALIGTELQVELGEYNGKPQVAKYLVDDNFGKQSGTDAVAKAFDATEVA